jgi:hypothetical protein
MLLPSMNSIISWFMRVFKKGISTFLPFISARVEKRIQQGTKRPDFMSRVLENNRDDGTGITRGEIDATSVILVVAGAETTATLLSGAVYFLLRNPDKLEKLRQEVDAKFRRAEEITIQKVSQMPYLLAVLEETLRVYPPVPIALARLAPKEGTSICGKWIPGGVSETGDPYVCPNLFRLLLEFPKNLRTAQPQTLSNRNRSFRKGGYQTRNPCLIKIGLLYCSPFLQDQEIAWERSTYNKIYPSCTS